MPAQPALPARYAWVDAYMLAKPLAIKEYKVAWEAVLYRVCGKIFGLLCQDNAGRLILNLKCDPYLCLYYRAEYPHVAPGWHMNKLHWNSLYLAGDTPDVAFKEMLDISYRLVCAGLPKKTRERIAREMPECIQRENSACVPLEK